jgi:hypothetical protein
MEDILDHHDHQKWTNNGVFASPKWALVTCYYMLGTSLLTCNFWHLFDLHTTINQKVIGLDVENYSRHTPVRRTTDSAIIDLKSWPSCFKCHAMYILIILLVVFNVEMSLKVILAFLLAVVSRLNWIFKWGSCFFDRERLSAPLYCHIYYYSVIQLVNCYVLWLFTPSPKMGGGDQVVRVSIFLRFRRKKLGSLFRSTK